MFNGSETVLCSFSAGPDSVYLLHHLKEKWPKLNITLIYFDHGLRDDEVGFEKKLTRDYAKLFNCSYRIKKLPVKAYSEKNACSIETAGRQLRRRFLTHYAHFKGCTHVVTAHHQDDHFETFFLQLLRGSQSGLQGIKQQTFLSSTVTLYRPLLHLSKQEILQVLDSRKLPYSIDSTNTDTIYTRNKIRQTLMPVLAEIEPAFRRQLEKTIVYQQHLQSELDASIASYIQQQDLNQNEVKLLPEFLQKHTILRWLQKWTDFKDSDKHIQAVHIENVRQLLFKARSKVQIPGGYVVQAKQGKLTLLFFS